MSDSFAQQIIGRFAPSPTGYLHIGSMLTAVASYIMAKQSRGLWLLRLDDLDRQRQMPAAADDIMRTLESYGLFWDGCLTLQSGNLAEYEEAFSKLVAIGAIFACSCSRNDIATSASAPHSGEEEIAYQGCCRNGRLKEGLIRSWRVRVTAEEIGFMDLRKGYVGRSLQKACGDFPVRRGDGQFAYQLAVVVDDWLTGVSQVVRGEDLLESTPRQLFLQRLLGYKEPQYCHLPLVTGAHGAKLSKRDNLVSASLQRHVGNERHLLLNILSLLGQNPPGDLAESGCEDILRWGVDNFRCELMPERGAALPVCQ